MSRSVINSDQYHVPIPGFSQIVEVPVDSRLLFVSGLTARRSDGTIAAVGDAAGQMRQIFENLTTVLEAANASLDDVVSIRTYVTDIGCWADIEPIWQEHWGERFPASTLVQVTRLFDERQLIEMEATARMPV